MSTKRTACPHCGGTSGINYVAKMTALRCTTWDGIDDEEIEMRKFTRSNFGKCADCGKRVEVEVSQ